MVDLARQRFVNYLDAHHLKGRDVIARWNNGTPEEVKDLYGVMYYGLAAIRSFGDKADTPYFRGLVPFLLANDLAQCVEECVYAMRQNPARENIPVLNAIWEDYKSHRYPSDDSRTLLPIYLANALAAQNDVATIPTLLDLLGDRLARDSALAALRQLTKEDFRTDAEWKSWYASRSRGAAAPAPPATQEK